MLTDSKISSRNVFVHLLDCATVQNQSVVDGAVNSFVLSTVEREDHIEFGNTTRFRNGGAWMEANNKFIEVDVMNVTDVPHVVAVNRAFDTITAEDGGAVLSDTRSRDREVLEAARSRREML